MNRVRNHVVLGLDQRQEVADFLANLFDSLHSSDRRMMPRALLNLLQALGVMEIHVCFRLLKFIQGFVGFSFFGLLPLILRHYDAVVKLNFVPCVVFPANLSRERHNLDILVGKRAKSPAQIWPRNQKVFEILEHLGYVFSLVLGCEP